MNKLMGSIYIIANIVLAVALFYMPRNPSPEPWHLVDVFGAMAMTSMLATGIWLALDALWGRKCQ